MGMDIVASGIGGVIIGGSAGALWLLHGRIAGISGIYGRTVTNSSADLLWRLAFLVGLLVGGGVLHAIYPAAFVQSEAAASTAVQLVAGLLVGYGTQLGNGCTSGHGVCGLSRMSLRSVAATLTFMACGALTSACMRAAASHALFSAAFWQAAVSGRVNAVAPVTNSSLADLATPLLYAALGFAAMALLARVSRAARSATLANLSTALPGFTFAIGLGLSGMTNAAKVTAFLDPFGHSWDPSLMFVMGGALLVNTAIYRLSQRMHRPYLEQCIYDCKFDAPRLSAITPELIVGAAMFGVGWGVAGRCPGPAIIGATEAFFDLARGMPALLFVTAMSVGIIIHHFAPLKLSK